MANSGLQISQNLTSENTLFFHVVCVCVCVCVLSVAESELTLTAKSRSYEPAQEESPRATDELKRGLKGCGTSIDSICSNDI